jgi:hypothetical protein
MRIDIEILRTPRYVGIGRIVLSAEGSPPWAWRCDREPLDLALTTILSPLARQRCDDWCLAVSDRPTRRADVRTSVMEKRRLRREMLAGPMAHLAEVAGMAKREHPAAVARGRGGRNGREGIAL